MVKRILQSIFTRLGVSFINLLVLLISSRYLGVSSRGEISLFLFNIAVLQILTETLTGYHLVHFTKGRISQSLYFSGILAILLISGTGNGMLGLLGKLIPGYEMESLILTVLVLLNSFHLILLICAGKLNRFNLLSVLQPALLLGFLFAAIYLLKLDTFIAYIYPMLFAFFLASFFSGLLIWPMLLPGEKTQWKSLVWNGLFSQTAMLMFLLVNRFSFYFFESPADLGLYSSGCQITESVLLPVSAALTVFLSDHHSEEKGAGWQSRIVPFAWFSLLFCALALLFLSLIPEWLFLKLLGEGFTGISGVLLSYSPAVLATAFSMVLMNALISSGSAILVVKSFAPGFVLTLVLVPILIKQFGLQGAALAAFTVQFSNAVVLSLVFRKKRNNIGLTPEL